MRRYVVVLAVLLCGVFVPQASASPSQTALVSSTASATAARGACGFKISADLDHRDDDSTADRTLRLAGPICAVPQPVPLSGQATWIFGGTDPAGNSLGSEVDKTDRGTIQRRSGKDGKKYRRVSDSVKKGLRGLNKYCVGEEVLQAGHLVAGILGGPGNKLENFVAVSKADNLAMYQQVEGQIVKVIRKYGGEWSIKAVPNFPAAGDPRPEIPTSIDFVYEQTKPQSGRYAPGFKKGQPHTQRYTVKDRDAGKIRLRKPGYDCKGTKLK